MAGFKADPGSIEQLAALLQRQGEAAGAYATAAENNKTTPGNAGDFDAILEGQLVYLREVGIYNTRKGKGLAEGTAGVLLASANLYRTTDQTWADALHPPVSSPRHSPSEFPQGVASGGFGDVTDVRGYSGPGDVNLEDDIDWPVEIESVLGKIGDQVSIATKVAEYIAFFTKVNVIEKVAEYIAGDWASIYREYKVLADTGIAFEAITTNIQRGRLSIQDRWDGNAAAGAENWLDSYARAAKEHARYCREAAEKIRLLAEASYHMYQLMEMALSCLIDLVIEIVAEVKNFPLDDIIDDAWAMFTQRPRLKKLIKTLRKYAGDITAVTDALFGIGHAFRGTVQLARAQGDVVRAMWPQAAYDHPGVR